MKHDSVAFAEAVKEYRKLLPKNISIAVFYRPGEWDAFYSLAPLSMAAHKNGCDLFALGADGRVERLLTRLWSAEGDKTIEGFIRAAERKAKGFRRLFKRPHIVLNSGKDGFTGDRELPYHASWLKKRRSKTLSKTCALVWKEVFAPKREERLAISFELVPGEPEAPLEDYLDNFYIAGTMAESRLGKNVLSLRATTSRSEMNARSEAMTELLATLSGCELSKWSEETVFRKYRDMSRKFGLSALKPAHAVFGIFGKGFHGRHLFGEKIGYPAPGGKTRWNSPAAMLYKFPWLPQSERDPRAPRSRIAFTQTIPVEEFIETNLIDWKEMRRENRRIQNILKRCEKVEVKGPGKSSCDFVVRYRRADGTLRGIKRSDSDARQIVDPDMLRDTGKKFGMMANIPGGECFLTPEDVEGRIVGDVVVSIDDSYGLSRKDPLVINATGKSYTFKGPKRIVDKLREHRKDSKRRIMMQRKSAPKSITEMKLANFDHIGEFAINTNSKAKRSRYLIVNEKIAKMIHIALGSGFDSDTATEYHCDIVIDSPRQKLDVIAYDSRDRTFPIILKGKMVV